MMDKLLMTYLVVQGTAANKIRARRENGQGILEYIAAMALALIVILLLVTTFTTAGQSLQTKVAELVKSVTDIK